MNQTFIEKVRTNKVKSPIKYGFKIEQWNAEWEKKYKDAHSKSIYEAGKIIDSILAKLASLFDNNPNIDDEKLIMAYFAVANRDAKILSENLNELQVDNIFSITIDNNEMGNELTLQEIADGCVDGLANAISLCKKRINKNTKTNKNLPSIDFIIKESYFSQLYGMYESYWHGLLWGGHILVEINKKQKIYSVWQPNTELERGAFVSQIRKQKLAINEAVIIQNLPDSIMR
jgi:hypothetical protein